MRLFCNLNDDAVSLSLYERGHLSLPVPAKRGDATLLELQFHRDGTPTLLSAPLLFFVLKEFDDFGGTEVVFCDSFTTPGDASGFYTGTPDLNLDTLRDLLVDGTVSQAVADQTARYALTSKPVGYIVRQDDDKSYWIVIDDAHLGDAAGWDTAPQKEYVDLSAEIVRREAPAFNERSSQSFIVRVSNDYLKGGETSPAAGDPFGLTFIANRYDITALTGGASNALDSIVTAGQNLVGALIAIDADDAAVFWRLRQTVISAISVAAAAVVTTTRAHGLTTGQTVTIGGSNSTPTIDGNRVVTVLSATTFSVPVTTTVGGSAGYASPAEQILAGLIRPDDFNASTNPVFWASAL